MFFGAILVLSYCMEKLLLCLILGFMTLNANADLTDDYEREVNRHILSTAESGEMKHYVQYGSSQRILLPDNYQQTERNNQIDFLKNPNQQNFSKLTAPQKVYSLALALRSMETIGINVSRYELEAQKILGPSDFESLAYDDPEYYKKTQGIIHEKTAAFKKFAMQKISSLNLEEQTLVGDQTLDHWAIRSQGNLEDHEIKKLFYKNNSETVVKVLAATGRSNILANADSFMEYVCKQSKLSAESHQKIAEQFKKYPDAIKGTIEYDMNASILSIASKTVPNHNSLKAKRCYFTDNNGSHKSLSYDEAMSIIAGDAYTGKSSPSTATTTTTTAQPQLQPIAQCNDSELNEITFSLLKPIHDKTAPPRYRAGVGHNQCALNARIQLGKNGQKHRLFVKPDFEPERKPIEFRDQNELTQLLKANRIVTMEKPAVQEEPSLLRKGENFKTGMMDIFGTKPVQPKQQTAAK